MENDLVYFYGIPVYFLAILSLIPVVYFAITWPKKLVMEGPYSTSVRRFLRWANSLSWLCLSLALFAWGAHSTPLALVMILLGGAIYLMYMVLLAASIRRPRKQH